MEQVSICICTVCSNPLVGGTKVGSKEKQKEGSAVCTPRGVLPIFR